MASRDLASCCARARENVTGLGLDLHFHLASRSVPPTARLLLEQLRCQRRRQEQWQGKGQLMRHADSLPRPQVNPAQNTRRSNT
jgi:hypothetical protein